MMCKTLTENITVFTGYIQCSGTQTLLILVLGGKKQKQLWCYCSCSCRSLIFTKESPLTHNKSFEISLWGRKSSNENISFNSLTVLYISEIKCSFQIASSSDVLRKTPFKQNIIDTSITSPEIWEDKRNMSVSVLINLQVLIRFSEQNCLHLWINQTQNLTSIRFDRLRPNQSWFHHYNLIGKKIFNEAALF